MPETKYFNREIELSSHSDPPGLKFPAKLAYWTFGSPSNPAVLVPSCYSGLLANTMPFLYSSKDGNDDPPFLPEKYFVIVVGLMGGGESSSPSNQPAPYDGPRFPKLSYEDNIRLQYALCTEELGISQLFAYVGFSMGGRKQHPVLSVASFSTNNFIYTPAALYF